MTRRPPSHLGARRIARLLAAAALVAPVAAGAPAERAKPPFLAVLIGVGDDGASDVDRLAGVLTDRLGVARESIVALKGPNATRDAIAKAVPPAVHAFPSSSRLVYYSGRLLKDAAGKVYYATTDADPASPAATALPADSLRRWLDACDGDLTLLVDADGEQGPPIAKPQLGYLGSGARGPEAARLTGWICRGLSGAADVEGDGRVSFSELERYAVKAAELARTPIHRRRPDSDFHESMTIRPSAFDPSYRRIAELIDARARAEGATRIAVLPFQSEQGEVDPFRNVGADELRRGLRALAGEAYAVADADASAPHPGRRDDGDVSHRVVARYTVLPGPNVVRLRCSLVKAAGDGEPIPFGTEVLALDANSWALFNRGHQVDREDVDAVNVKPVSDPGRALKFPISICLGTDPAKLKEENALKMEVDSKDPCLRTLEVPDGNHPYTILVTNPTKHRVYCRVLIDGVNTVVQDDSDEDFSAVPLEKARGYVLEPGKTFQIDHWRRNAGRGAQNRRFEFAPEEEAVAARVNPSGEVGTITVAFYRESIKMVSKGPSAPKGRVGTGMGEVVAHDVPTGAPISIDKAPMAVEIIRYVRRADAGRGPR
ncbi:MAG: hypothetical protein BGO49_10970 [Planctomycetales bacterium 71-10]|nr:MAG: hypothetical protein BGO49_10970 [Planctomycetales bacterium 71-10]